MIRLSPVLCFTYSAPFDCKAPWSCAMEGNEQIVSLLQVFAGLTYLRFGSMRAGTGAVLFGILCHTYCTMSAQLPADPNVRLLASDPSNM